MARLARVILPNYPHHIIQRGNRRQDVFFADEDYQYYLELLKEWCDQEDIEVWAYCLMTNHVHLIVLSGNSFKFKPCNWRDSQALYPHDQFS